MKTRQKDRETPGPQAPWNEIRPLLWMGGHYWTDQTGELQPAIAGSEFDLVISLFTLPGHGPHPGVEHLISEIPDGPLTVEQIRSVQQLALTASYAVRSGRTVLVRCHSGYNRSGLVVAQALIELGQDAATAVEVIRRRRSPWALNNQTFEQYLTAGLDVACLLTGLDALT
ncbi:dual specificity protein phosphatase family protein [Kitasatospora sp. Root107]|uniref:protein-tyrosine phosphatase family protein n=1 Tax=Kitasatospora sp. Root107 TaxID=1736424 RepID=UPI00070B039E|nr:dual specificity protein phosphatase family protein [Kitasatospora sp. Root107]KQV12652.1 protein phosphatase [Kitasatospora sp. Root107]